MNMKYVQQRLQAITDGRESFEGLSEKTCLRAAKIAKVMFIHTPNVVPGEEGTVSFVWHAEGMSVTLDISEDAAVFWVMELD